MNTYDTILGSAQSKFTKLVKRPERFLKPDQELFDEIKLLSKVLYDVGKITELSDQVGGEGSTLSELVIDGFDEEQVWAGIELQNQSSFSKWRRRIVKCRLKNESCMFLKEKVKTPRVEESFPEDVDINEDDRTPDAEPSDHETEDSENEIEQDPDDMDILDDPDFQNMSDSDMDDLPLFENLSEDEKSEHEEGTYRAREKKMSKEKSDSRLQQSEVDDQFFKLRDMEKFLEAEDRREETGGGAQDDEDDIDLFGDIEDGEDDGPAMYSTYFRDEDQSLDGENDDRSKMVEGEESEADSDKGEEDSDDESMDDGENDFANDKMNLLADNSDSEAEGQAVEPKSTHEKSVAKLQKHIDQLEDAAISEKPWQLGGEAAAPIRPENSLLAEDLDYESGVRAAPIITEAVSRRLEDIITQRIKDEAWDDVERKVKPVESAQEYKKKLVLDQEKSKLSLAQVYEEEYLRISQAQEKLGVPGLLDKDADEAAVPLEVKQIKEDMRLLFMKLDTLTHNHYTPKLKSSELKVVRNVASLAMEEVAPVGASNADLLAPAEVVDKTKGELMTEADKTKTDRKRERRAKKLKVKAKLQEKARKDKDSNRTSVTKDIENAEKQGKLKTIKEKDKNQALKSSTAFFNVLQEEARSNVKAKTGKGSTKKKDSTPSLSAIKM